MCLWPIIYYSLNVRQLLQHSYQNSMILLCEMDSASYNVNVHTQQSSKLSLTHARPCVPMFLGNETFSNTNK